MSNPRAAKRHSNLDQSRRSPNDGGISLGQAALAALCRVESANPMHELSIAMSIVEIAEEEAERRGGATWKPSI